MLFFRIKIVCLDKFILLWLFPKILFINTIIIISYKKNIKSLQKKCLKHEFQLSLIYV